MPAIAYVGRLAPPAGPTRTAATAPDTPTCTPPWTPTPAWPHRGPAEKAATCATFLRRATAWFAARGVPVERVLTDNAWAYTKNTWRQTCRDLGIGPRWTRPWRPQTSGKVSHVPDGRGCSGGTELSATAIHWSRSTWVNSAHGGISGSWRRRS